jgi:hypothetical protein
MNGIVHDFYGEEASIDRANVRGALVVGLAQVVALGAGFMLFRLAAKNEGVALVGGLVTMRITGRVLSRWFDSIAARAPRS